jgi:diketogulonate reductase-like aldo/keto reductase
MSPGSTATTTLRLNTGRDMPLVGLGTWQAPRGVVGAAVADALRAGYTHVDCAAAYANEFEVGDALHAAFERGTLRREDVFVTSKLWNDRRKPEDVRAGLRQTLEDLRLEYLDMYLIHWPVVWKRGTLMQDDPDASLAECWEALERAMDEGLVRGIGVSNFSERQLAELIRVARVKPAVNQIEIHPRLPQTELVRYCQSQGVQVTAYSPLARGGGLLDHPAVVRAATRLGVTPAQAALRWNVQNGVVVIPKSVTPARIAQNADIFGFELGADDMDELEAVNDGVTTSTSPWSDSGPTARRNRVLRPILAFVLRPFFWLVRVDVQRMGRSGFIRWAWSE